MTLKQILYDWRYLNLFYRMRLSLGLKPLQVESSADKERAAHTAAVAVKAAEAKKIEEATMAEHIKE